MFKKLIRFVVDSFVLSAIVMALVGWWTLFRDMRDVFLDRMRAKRS